MSNLNQDFADEVQARIANGQSHAAAVEAVVARSELRDFQSAARAKAAVSNNQAQGGGSADTDIVPRWVHAERSERMRNGSSWDFAVSSPEEIGAVAGFEGLSQAIAGLRERTPSPARQSVSYFPYLGTVIEKLAGKFELRMAVNRGFDEAGGLTQSQRIKAKEIRLTRNSLKSFPFLWATDPLVDLSSSTDGYVLLMMLHILNATDPALLVKLTGYLRTATTIDDKYRGPALRMITEITDSQSFGLDAPEFLTTAGAKLTRRTIGRLYPFLHPFMKATAYTRARELQMLLSQDPIETV